MALASWAIAQSSIGSHGPLERVSVGRLCQYMLLMLTSWLIRSSSFYIQLILPSVASTELVLGNFYLLTRVYCTINRGYAPSDSRYVYPLVQDTGSMRSGEFHVFC